MQQHGTESDIPILDTQEVLDRFGRTYDEARNIADGVHQPIKVKAVMRMQGGLEILVAKCPKCSTVAALSGEGRHLCRTCFSWLRYVREG